MSDPIFSSDLDQQRTWCRLAWERNLGRAVPEPDQGTFDWMLSVLKAHGADGLEFTLSQTPEAQAFSQHRRFS